MKEHNSTSTSNYVWCKDVHKYWAILYAIILILFGFLGLSESKWATEFSQYFSNAFFENIGKNYVIVDFFSYVIFLFSISVLLMPLIFLNFLYCSRKRWDCHVSYVTKKYTRFQYMFFIWFSPIAGYIFLSDILNIWYEPGQSVSGNGGGFYIRSNSIIMMTAWAYLVVVGFCHGAANTINYFTNGIEREKFR